MRKVLLFVTFLLELYSHISVTWLQRNERKNRDAGQARHIFTEWKMKWEGIVEGRRSGINNAKINGNKL